MVVWISQKLLIACNFHARQSLEFADNDGGKKHPVSSSEAGKNALLLREVRGEGPPSCQSWAEGDSNANNHILQQWYAEEHLWTQHVKPQSA